VKIIRAKSAIATPKPYQRTVLPSLSGMKGMARAATKGRRIIVDNQGTSIAFITADDQFFDFAFNYYIILRNPFFCKRFLPKHFAEAA
jgi:hypothetical protein